VRDSPGSVQVRLIHAGKTGEVSLQLGKLCAAMRVADCDLNDLGFIGSRLNGVLVATIHRSNLLKSFRFFNRVGGVVTGPASHTTRHAGPHRAVHKDANAV